MKWVVQFGYTVLQDATLQVDFPEHNEPSSSSMRLVDTLIRKYRQENDIKLDPEYNTALPKVLDSANTFHLTGKWLGAKIFLPIIPRCRSWKEAPQTKDKKWGIIFHFWD